MRTLERPARRPPRLLAISDLASWPGDGRRAEGDRGVGEWIERLVDAGVDALQLREKDLHDARLLALSRQAVEVAAGRLEVLVNGRVDITLAAAAGGVHLPAAGVPAAAVRRRWPKLLVGVSTHHPREVEAVAGVVDYVLFGPVYETPGKKRFGPPLGVAGLAAACRLGVPVLAVGGVTAQRLPEIAAAGATGVAAIRALQQPESLVKMAAHAARLWRRH